MSQLLFRCVLVLFLHVPFPGGDVRSCSLTSRDTTWCTRSPRAQLSQSEYEGRWGEGPVGGSRTSVIPWGSLQEGLWWGGQTSSPLLGCRVSMAVDTVMRAWLQTLLKSVKWAMSGWSERPRLACVWALTTLEATTHLFVSGQVAWTLSHEPRERGCCRGISIGAFTAGCASGVRGLLLPWPLERNGPLSAAVQTYLLPSFLLFFLLSLLPALLHEIFVFYFYINLTVLLLSHMELSQLSLRQTTPLSENVLGGSDKHRGHAALKWPSVTGHDNHDSNSGNIKLKQLNE